MSEKASIAVVGTGWWATTAHLPAMKAHPRIGKIVLVDRKREAAEAAARTYAIPLERTILATNWPREFTFIA